MALHVFVIKEAELEDPQDLRARSRKFLNLTNERNNMSTKTLRKRISLVAVSALGAGLLSVVAAPSANAAVGDLTIYGNATTNAAAVLDTSSSKSQGLIGSSGTDYSATSGQTMVATLAANGTLALKMEKAPSSGSLTTKATVSGATISNVDAGVLALNATSVSAANNTDVYFLVKPNAGVTSFTVATSSITTAGVSTTTAKLTVSVSAVAAIGAPSVSNSYLRASGTTASGAIATSVDVLNKFADAATGYVYVDVYDVNDQSVATGVLSASATGNVLVAWNGAPTALSSNTAVTTGYRGELQVIQSVDNAPTTSVVTVSYNGVVIGTKTLTFQGAAAAINVASIKHGKAGDANSGKILYYLTVTDSAGNQIVPIRDVTAEAANDDGIIGAVTITAQNNTTTPGYGTYACASATKLGKSAITFELLNEANVKITKKVDVGCYGDIVTYTASLDKATYNTGDIATLTITAKDSKGNQANDVVTLGATQNTVTDFGNLTLIGGVSGAPTNTDTGTNGVWTYKLRVGTEAGAYTGVVSLPTYNATASAPTQGPVTLQYKVVDGSSGVSNADVLKAIVSLIASINKQIAALQKALLRR
jgi:hypothetical protein